MKKFIITLSILATITIACKRPQTTVNLNTDSAVTISKPSNNTIQQNSTSSYITYTCKPQEVIMFWKNDNGEIFKHYDTLIQYLKNQNITLNFAMNAGIFQTDFSPLGLYVENEKTLHKINKSNGYGNFYMSPNGIFYTTKNGTANISTTTTFKNNNILYATQSGPMLLIDSSINKQFQQGSTNLNIRNGVGILPNGDCIFIMSHQPVNFYNFAQQFLTMGCTHALYLDGAISQTYLPSKGYHKTTGNFAVIIGTTNKE